MGLPRPPRRVRGRHQARHQIPRPSPRHGHRQVQRGVPQGRRPTHRRMGGGHHEDRSMDRFQERLQDHGHLLHGERLVGLRSALQEGSRISWIQGAHSSLSILIRVSGFGIRVSGLGLGLGLGYEFRMRPSVQTLFRALIRLVFNVPSFFF